MGWKHAPGLAKVIGTTPAVGEGPHPQPNKWAESGVQGFPGGIWSSHRGSSEGMLLDGINRKPNSVWFEH